MALWENDASNLMGDEEFRRRAKEGFFRYLQHSELTPEQAYPAPGDSAKRDEYRIWLGNRETEQDPIDMSKRK